MLDTNVYIDMFVSRNGNHKPETYKNLKDLLDTGEISLLVPQIVIAETFRHVDSEIEKLQNNIKEAKKLLNNIYWVNSTVELEKFDSFLNPAKENIKALVEEFKRNKNEYKKEFRKRLNQLFYHDNSIILKENEEIMYKANQRGLYKKRPFHFNKPNKDSLPDSVIIETLINIKSCADLEIDLIVFISTNPKDFSVDEKENREKLHDDILKDIRKNGLSEKVKYSTLFTKTLLEVFSKEIKDANLTIQFEAESKLENARYVEEWRASQIETCRESGGLPSLSADYEEILADQREIKEFMYLLQRMTQKLTEPVDLYDENYEELRVTLKSKRTIIKKDPLIKLIFPIGDKLNEDELANIITSRTDIQINEDFKSNIVFSEVLNFNSTLLKFKDFDNNSYSVAVENDLSPQDGGEDTLLLAFKKNENVIVRGEFKIQYGFLEFNEDLNVGDSQEFQIDSDIEKLSGELEIIVNKIVGEIEEKDNGLKGVLEELQQWK